MCAMCSMYSMHRVYTPRYAPDNNRFVLLACSALFWFVPMFRDDLLDLSANAFTCCSRKPDYLPAPFSLTAQKPTKP